MNENPPRRYKTTNRVCLLRDIAVSTTEIKLLFLDFLVPIPTGLFPLPPR
jgi:hypothetical protein